ncbi:MAG TPA: aldehyde ferredoxin oxidoreductase family protein [Thermodesulfobacteriota bacterium]|nr:aldehyde ferredoxin oxidoreductase family protein [Thermodesulfobacteriota bacterium]
MAGISYRILEVDLSSGQSKVIEYGEEALRKYFGGSGLAASILLDRFDSSLVPFHPQSPLIFMTGLFTGIPVPCGCRVSICAKSPLRIWGEANAGGYWGPELKFTGFDGLIITGKAKEPSYLWVTPKEAEIRSAKALWGKGTFETTEELAKQTDPKARVAAIGPAGESLSYMAGIITGGLEARVMARSGPGAIMGSKNLKAVVVRGDQKPFIINQKILQEVTKEFLLNLRFVEGLSKFGTASVIESKEAAGVLPIKNFTQAHWDKAKKIAGPALVAKYLERHYGCYSCPIRCGKDVKGPEGPYAGVVGHGPEYETLSAFGSLILNDDLKSLIHLNFLCNDLGLDSMSAGITAAFAIESNLRGYLKENDGLDLQWGNAQSVGVLLEKIARRQGIGAIFADGVKKASRALGKGTEYFALHSKGVEVSLSNPTPTVSLALSWATSNRGACHLEGFSHQVEGGVPFPEMGYTQGMDGISGEGKGRMTALMQDYMAVFNALGLCKFLFFARVSHETLCKWLKGLAGWDLTSKDLMEVGERLYNLKRAYNVLMGVNAEKDVVAPRILENLRPEKPISEGRKLFFDMRKEYYEARGWDEKGIPTRERLLSLGLEGAAEKIKRK